MTNHTVNYKSTIEVAEDFENKIEMVETKLQEQKANMEHLIECLQSLTLSTTYSENIAKMVCSITHEVRNPLTSISGFLQLIKQTNNLHSIHQYTDLALSELTRANDLITDFLNLSKSQSKESHPLSINKLIKEMSSVFMSEANLKGIILNIDLISDEPLCIIHEQHLTQVIVNVVKNAFEATEANHSSNQKEVVIQTKVSRDHLLVIVKDNGCGMTEEQLNHLYTPLKTTKKNGTGIGLYVCKKLIEKYNGTMKVQSAIEKGTTITIQLPFYFLKQQ